MDYPTTTVELTSLDLMNFQTLLESRINDLRNSKHDMPDLAQIFDEQIEIHSATLQRVNGALAKMFPAFVA